MLPKSFQESYDPLDAYGMDYPLGSGLSRNYAWHLAEEKGADWHWVIDDNLHCLYRLNDKGLFLVTKGPRWFGQLESFITQWRNVGMGGPQHEGFVVHRYQKVRRAVKNTRIYSFNLIRTRLPYRWRGRFNEDTILALDMLTNRWATILTHQYMMRRWSPRGQRREHRHIIQAWDRPQVQDAGQGLSQVCGGEVPL